MCCFWAVIALIAPRVALLAVWILTTYIRTAYHTLLWPILGLIFMPLTTLAYAYAINRNGQVTGLYFAVTIIAALIDLASWGGGYSRQRRSR